MSVFDVIVVGAGHAGIGISYHLKSLGLNHLVLERGKIGESWRSQRWDTFKLNTANKINLLPGEDYEGIAPENFASAYDFVSQLKTHAERFQLPIEESS